MSQKLNYGKRFRSGAVGVGYHYDAALEAGIDPWRGKRAPKGTLRAVYNDAKGQAAARAKRGVGSLLPPAAKPDVYREAELALIERIKKAVEIIEFGLEELNGLTTKTERTATLVDRRTALDLVRHIKATVKNWTR